MSIPHIEELDPEEFLHVLENLDIMHITEKLDGANLLVGLDDRGYLYTSRAEKGDDRKRLIMHDWSLNAYDNPFRAAHSAIYTSMSAFYRELQPGDQLEVEVLFGRQPNAIVYGDCYIVFLRMIRGDPARARQLFRFLRNQGSVHVSCPVITSDIGQGCDPMKTKFQIQDNDWNFTFVPEISETEIPDLVAEIKHHRRLQEEHPVTRFKTKREMRQFYQPFQLSTKEVLLTHLVRCHTPTFRTIQINDAEDFGIEGIVLYDPTNGKQYKIVDKSVFTIINQFYHSARNQLKRTTQFNLSANKHLFTKFDTDIGYSEGPCLYDVMLDRIAKTIELPKLAKYMQLTRNIKKYKTMEAFLSAWKSQNVHTLGSEIREIVQNAVVDVCLAYQRFTNRRAKFELVLTNGRTIRYTPAIIERTNLAFVTLHQELLQMMHSASKARTMGELACAIYGGSLNSLT